mmetsp:Transcript_20857/g.45328  ORF Transcript_20857/g.45328 Transcript_20857/m.45328 type:complete len:529 (-) Transcript_20857:139-1725(-)
MSGRKASRGENETWFDLLEGERRRAPFAVDPRAPVGFSAVRSVASSAKRLQHRPHTAESRGVLRHGASHSAGPAPSGDAGGSLGMNVLALTPIASKQRDPLLRKIDSPLHMGQEHFSKEQKPASRDYQQMEPTPTSQQFHGVAACPRSPGRRCKTINASLAGGLRSNVEIGGSGANGYRTTPHVISAKRMTNSCSACCLGRHAPVHLSSALNSTDSSIINTAPPPPPPAATAGTIPAEYAVYSAASERRPVELGRQHGASRHSGFRVFPATQPAGRAEALRLGEVLDEMLDAAGSNSAEALRAWDEVFGELVRQVFMNCSERGELLGRVRRAYQYYISEMARRLHTSDGSVAIAELRHLQDELSDLREQLAGYAAESVRNKMRRVISAIALASKRAASPVAQDNKAEPESALAVSLSKLLRDELPEDEREATWMQMISAMPLAETMRLLDVTMHHLSDDGQQQMALRLLENVPIESLRTVILELIFKVPETERLWYVTLASYFAASASSLESEDGSSSMISSRRSFHS